MISTLAQLWQPQGTQLFFLSLSINLYFCHCNSDSLFLSFFLSLSLTLSIYFISFPSLPLLPTHTLNHVRELRQSVIILNRLKPLANLKEKFSWLLTRAVRPLILDYTRARTHTHTHTHTLHFSFYAAS